MAYTTLSDSLVDIDSPVDTDLMSGLRTNIRELRLQVHHLYIAETTNNSATYETVATRSVYIPDFPAEDDWTQYYAAQVQLKTDNASNAAYYQIEDSATGSTSSEVTTTFTSYQDAETSLSIPSAWKGTTRTILHKIKNASTDVASVKNNGITARLYY